MWQCDCNKNSTCFENPISKRCQRGAGSPHSSHVLLHLLLSLFCFLSISFKPIQTHCLNNRCLLLAPLKCLHLDAQYWDFKDTEVHATSWVQTQGPYSHRSPCAASLLSVWEKSKTVSQTAQASCVNNPAKKKWTVLILQSI